ncbi:MAG: hypothetical protein O2910_05690, partial [Proteobacteria bacterium]|nr:hypothetical protein [Pseudomonadota bacterium]
VGIVLVPIVLARAAQFEIPLAQLPLVKYARYGNEAVQFVETQRMASFINQTVAEDAVVYHLGFEPNVYFWTGRKAPTGFVLSYPFYVSSVRRQGYIDRELISLKAIKPDLIVAKRMFFRSADNAIEAWIAENYNMIEGPQGIRDYLFLVPKVRNP